VELLLAVSADSLDSVERIRQTPSGESASRNFAVGVCKIRAKNDLAMLLKAIYRL
jgi:hypothetical protein